MFKQVSEIVVSEDGKTIDSVTGKEVEVKECKGGRGVIEQILQALIWNYLDATTFPFEPDTCIANPRTAMWAKEWLKNAGYDLSKLKLVWDEAYTDVKPVIFDSRCVFFSMQDGETPVFCISQVRKI